MRNIAKTRITRTSESACALPEEVTTMPSPIAVAVPYTGPSSDRKDSFTEQLISMRSISFVIAEGCRTKEPYQASAGFMHSLRLLYELFIAIGMKSEDAVKHGGGSAMSTLILGLLTLSAIPFLVFCLWGFHGSSGRRVIGATLLSPMPLSLNAPPGETVNQANVGPTAIAKHKQQTALVSPDMHVTALSAWIRAVPEDLHVPLGSVHIIVFDTPYRMN